jgi:hypothetical protein
MTLKDFKIVVWCGAAANQKALVNKIAASYKVAGIVIDDGSGSRKKRKLTDLPHVFLDHLRFHKIYTVWSNLMKYYDNKFPQWPDVPKIKVASINDPVTEVFTSKIRPDLIIVSGTALVKRPLMNFAASIGIINLHTGLSPFVKGGPNCTNWCIANNEWHFVGNTIMWLNAGIDAGNIITTEVIDIRNTSNLNEAHRMVMDHAHDLYLRAIAYLLNNHPPYISVPQKSLGNGKLFLTKMWTSEKRKDLLRNWKKRKSFNGDYPVVKTVSLNNNSHK